MRPLVDEALRTADLVAALANHKVGWGDYTRGRRLDPVFDLACQEIDLVIRQALLIQLESRAASGDYRAAKLLAGGLKEIREALRDQGVSIDAREDGRSYFPSSEVGGELYPVGPCLHCITGLVVMIPWLSGDDHEVVVRHDDARYYEVPPPQGYRTAKVLFGLYRDPARLIDPEAKAASLEGVED
jgi:hypothetical protein